MFVFSTKRVDVRIWINPCPTIRKMSAMANPLTYWPRTSFFLDSL